MRPSGDTISRPVPDALRAAAGDGFRFGLGEFTGAFADLGVLLPLMAGLIFICGMPAGLVLLTTGLFYLVTGIYYRLPVPVQPLKAMAVIAIASGGRVGPGELAAGAIIIGVILLLTRISGLSTLLKRAFADWTVKGIQLGIGLLLIKGGLLFLAGTAAMPGRAAPGLTLSLPSLLLPSLPGASSFVYALFFLVLPQLPVTIGNSIVATADTAVTYFRAETARSVSVKALCTTVGLANIVAGLFGSMPVCHGSGGLTAHYRLGARSGTAPVIMGLSLLLPALVLGDSAINLLLWLPVPLLGVLMLYVGLSHARLVLALWQSKPSLCIAFCVGAVSLLWGAVWGLTLGVGASVIMLGYGGLQRALSAHVKTDF